MTDHAYLSVHQEWRAMAVPQRIFLLMLSLQPLKSNRLPSTQLRHDQSYTTRTQISIIIIGVVTLSSMLAHRPHHLSRSLVTRRAAIRRRLTIVCQRQWLSSVCQPLSPCFLPPTCRGLPRSVVRRNRSFLTAFLLNSSRWVRARAI